jgi:hypothetical protein
MDFCSGFSKKVRLPAIFILVFILCVNLFAYRLFWWTMGSAGDMGTRGGMTAGQNAAGPVSGGASHSDGQYGFWVPELAPEICFNVDHDTWDLDSIDVYSTYTMMAGAQFTAGNCGNCAINYGLRFHSTTPIVWNAAYTTGGNRFTIRGHFTSSLVAPLVYDPALDYINDILTWCNGSRFGADGSSVPPSSGRYLWFQLISPLHSTFYGENTIILELYAQQNLP